MSKSNIHLTLSKQTSIPQNSIAGMLSLATSSLGSPASGKTERHLASAGDLVKVRACRMGNSSARQKRVNTVRNSDVKTLRPTPCGDLSGFKSAHCRNHDANDHFFRKMLPRTTFKWQHVNRSRTECRCTSMQLTLLAFPNSFRHSMPQGHICLEAVNLGPFAWMNPLSRGRKAVREGIKIKSRERTIPHRNQFTNQHYIQSLTVMYSVILADDAPGV
jgi:hypothetical protein